MKCIYCNNDMSNLIIDKSFKYPILKNEIHGNSSICNYHNNPPIYQFTYPTKFKKDLNVIWVIGNTFIIKIMFKENKTIIFNFSNNYKMFSKHLMTFDNIINVTPETVDEKIKSLLVFT